MEAAAHLVIDAPAGHRLEGVLHFIGCRCLGVVRRVRQQQRGHHRRGKLRPLGPRKTPMLRVVAFAQRRHRIGHRRRRHRPHFCRLSAPAHRVGHPHRLIKHRRPLVRPRPAHALHHLAKPRPPELRLRRDVRRRPVREQPVSLGPAAFGSRRRDENVHGPAPAAGQQLRCRHIDVVHVRPLLAIDLNAHKVLVEGRHQLGLLKHLALHHVAPVARGVAHTQKDRHVAPLRLGKRRLAPGHPVHRVVRVLQQIRTG